jgi:hypothetical protein
MNELVMVEWTIGCFFTSLKKMEKKNVKKKLNKKNRIDGDRCMNICIYSVR